MKQPIKILFCIDNLARGGTELQLIGLIERLDPNLYKPYLLTIRETELSLTPKNCQHLQWNLKSLFSLTGVKTLFRLIRFLQHEKIQIVQSYFQDSTILAGLAAYIARVPVRIACFRDMGFWNTKSQAIILRNIYRLMTGFICNAYVVRDYFVESFGISKEKSVILRNGIDVESLPFTPHRLPCYHVGIVGNMTRQVKRTDLFIKAAAIVAKEHPKITWHIIGDGRMRPELEQLAKNLNVFEKLHFAGRVSNVASYLEKLDIGVICSDSEGLSNALLEYMFKGVAAIVTDVGGNPELIENEKTGLLIPPDDEQALARAIIRIIENASLRSSAVKAARLKAEEEYSWDKCMAAHNKVYQSMLSK
jgi:glycosyltransferase involved in cell wall biosynthesis